MGSSPCDAIKDALWKVCVPRYVRLYRERETERRRESERERHREGDSVCEGERERSREMVSETDDGAPRCVRVSCYNPHPCT